MTPRRGLPAPAVHVADLRGGRAEKPQRGALQPRAAVRDDQDRGGPHLGEAGADLRAGRPRQALASAPEVVQVRAPPALPPPPGPALPPPVPPHALTPP